MSAKPLDEEALFQIVRRIESADERNRFLAHACADDPQMIQRVHTLLEALERHPEFLQATVPPTVSAAVSPSAAPSVGTTIGPYKLLQRLGEGGFGVVYMAQQEKPVQRMVALKVIKPGMDTDQVIARFESERQALALMEHPNIAKVLDAGATEAGRPYFVMELVKGVPITEFCDKNHMPPQHRLKLFIDVCHAIQHAHHKGVIHRYIKPSNVMVTLHDGVPVVKVIDFGVAKATAHRLTERTLFTAYGQMIGTPAYMSPEQAEMSGLDIDTRSDVYSLGVLLYELLTGTTPVESKRLREAGYAEMQRLIRELEPPRPSTRLSSLGESASIMAGNRGTDVRHLAQLLSGDLDWVVMKALDKDRNRRYGTPGSFAEDIERYLRDEAIQARPPSTIYKLKKFARRNRAAVLTTAAIAVTLLLGTIVATWQAVRATRAEAQVRLQRDRAERGFQQARAAVDDYFTTISESKLLDVPGLQPLRKELLDKALTYYQQFIDERRDDPSVKAELAATYYRVALITAIIGSKEEAHGAYESSLATFDDLIRDAPDNERFQIDRAIVCNDLGNLLNTLGKPDQALRLHRDALAAREHLAALHPREPRYHNELAKSHANVGYILSESGSQEEALAAYQRARDINAAWVNAPADSVAEFPTDLGGHFNKPDAITLDLAIEHASIGQLLYRMGRLDESIAAYDKAQALYEDLVKRNPDDPEFSSRLAGTYTSKAFYLGIGGKHDEAARSLQAAFAIVEPLVAQNPAITNLRSQLAFIHRELGRVHRRAGQLDQARSHLRRASELQEQLVREHPNDSGYERALAYVHRERGWVELVQKNPASAFDYFQKARTIDEKFAPDSVGARYDLACDFALSVPLIGWNKSPEMLSETERAEREALAVQAIATLRKAADDGWRNVDHLKKDEDLDSLRDRPDFQALIAELSKTRQ